MDRLATLLAMEAQCVFTAKRRNPKAIVFASKLLTQRTISSSSWEQAPSVTAINEYGTS
jgi:hypothetical protein